MLTPASGSHPAAADAVRPAQAACAARVTLSLNGVWQVEDSLSATDMPREFGHTAPVPGLANLARPPFEDVDLFDSPEWVANPLRLKLLPESGSLTRGAAPQERNYFWYRKTFPAPGRRAVTLLKINKAQFGTAVWLNGVKLGEYPGCFSASFFNLTDVLRWNQENELVIRIGAHPGVLPVTFPAGADFEKVKWTPGIYDAVSVYFCDNPVIAAVQVAPRIGASEVVVQTKLRNYGGPISTELGHIVKSWKSDEVLAVAEPLRVELSAGEERVLTQTIPLLNARLWSLEDPFLYLLETSTAGDNVSTRFGMREFRSDASTGRFYLNGKVCYLRGSNIALHRFFEDPHCGSLPWSTKWVRKLLAELPRQMHWNSFRLSLGPVPEQWLDIADEAGLLIQNEFPVWTGAPGFAGSYARHWDADEMARQFGDWMRDHWNHPSVVIWDACNETTDPIFAEKIIPAVRGLDLSDRPWDNGYNPPQSPNDPVELHPYFFEQSVSGEPIRFNLPDLERMDGNPNAFPLNAGDRLVANGEHGWVCHKGQHPILINEYGWVWLNRDGSPTLVTENLYRRLLGPDATATERFALCAYLLAAKTEFWRAHRQCAGILHFVYLTYSKPGGFTSDHFLDLEQLMLEPHFADFVGEAFKPLGVYLNFFQPTLVPGAERSFTIKLINDEARPVAGDVTLSLERAGGGELARVTRTFHLPNLGDATLEMRLRIPAASGPCMLKAVAKQEGAEKIGPTVCRRWVKLDKMDCSLEARNTL